MARKSNVQLLQEALAAGDIAKATELAKKIKVTEKPVKTKGKKAKEIVLVEAEVLERPVDRQQESVKIRRVYANRDAGSIAPSRGPAKKTGGGERQMVVGPMVPRRMDGWKDTGVDDKKDSVKTNVNFGAQRITERNRPPAEQVEAECAGCGGFFVIPESHLSLSGSVWRCSKCCARRG